MDRAAGSDAAQDAAPGFAGPPTLMAQLIASHDWSTSPLGAPDGWPQSLKTTVGVMLPAMAQIVLFWGPEFVALYNDAYAPTIGDKHPKALGRPARENWAELWDDLAPLLASVRETGETVYAKDRPFYIERHGYPETAYFDISYSAVPDESGGIGGVLCIVSETTERVLSEERVRTSEARFHAMADSIDQMIWSTQPDGYHDYYNQRWYDYTGVPEGSTDGEAWNGMFHPDDQERAWGVWRHCLETGEPYHIEYRLRHRSGAYRWVLGRAQPVRSQSGEIVRWYGTCTDIDDLKRAEEARHASDERFREVFQNAGVGMIEIDADWNILSANEAYCRITGRNEGELLGANCLSFTHPEDADVGAQALQSLAAGQARQISFEKRYLRPDGTTIWVRSNLSHVGGTQGTSRFLKVVEDITDVREAREALTESEERYRTLFESIDEGFCVIEFLDGPHGPLSDYVHISANPAYEQHAGITNVVGRKVRDMVPDEADRWVEFYRNVLVTGEPIRFEQELEATGRHLDLAAFRIEPPERRQVAVLFQDITARKRAAAALHETEERYRLATRATNDAIWDWDLVTNQVRWNEALCDAYGYGPAEVEDTGDWWIEHIHPEDRAEIDASIHAVIDGTGATWSGEYRFRRADGSYAEVLDRGAVIRDDAGNTVRMIGAMLDTTALRAAETAVRDSEDRLRLATDAAAIGIWDFDPRTGRLDWDVRTKEVFGFAPDKEVDYPAFLAALHPADRAATDAAVQHALSPDGPGGYDVEYRTVAADGTERWIAARGRGLFADGQAVRFIGTVIDISERKQAEAALAESEAALREESRTLETLNGVAASLAPELDLQRVVQLVTDAGVELSGAQFGAFFYNVTDNSGESYMLYSISGVDPAEFSKFPMPRNTAVFAPTFGGEGVVRSDDITRDPRYGHNKPHKGMPKGHLPVRSYLAVPVTSRSGEVIGGLFFGHEEAARFTERHERLLSGIAGQAAVSIDNARLFEASQRLNRTLESQVAERTAERDRIWQVSGDLLGVADNNGRWVSVNPAWTRILGWEADEIVGRTSEWLEHPDDRDVTRAEVAKLAAGVPTIGFENRFRTRDGDYRILSWTAVPVEASLYCTARDVTEERARQAQLEQAQEALRQSQKMEAVGQLTGGIAHDFNNLLTVITGNVDAARRHLGDQAEARIQRALGNALIGAERAATLTQRLLAFSRRQPLNPRPTDINRLVTGMSELLHRTLGETIEVETVLGAGLWQAEVDPHQLENAIINLAVNARDAMPEGGKLTIETANMHLDHDYAAKNAGATAGQYVAICVSDIGAGMDADTLARAFEPFFTTKDVGKGTGLGLSMVYGFVKQSGGHLKIYSEESQGTTVRIYLPRLIGAEAQEEAHAEPPVPEGTREETILVCEDDDDVRAYTVDVLRELGYRVLEAHDGASAIRLLERQEGKVDLLFTDVVLPGGMTGAVVAKEARTLRPDLKILFTTGYARNAIVHHGRLDPGVELITKPFAYADLAARIRDMLDRR